MKVRWNGKTEFFGLTNGKIYEVISTEKDWYRIIDDSGEDYLYPPEQFDIINDKTLYCPVCGQTVFECWSDYEQCDICGWYNDGIQYINHGYEGGCNKKSVNQLKEEWQIKQLNAQKDYGIKLQYLGKPFTGHVLTVYISEDENTKAKAVQTIE